MRVSAEGKGNMETVLADTRRPGRFVHALAAVAVVAVIGSMAPATASHSDNRIPLCAEDEIVRGVGDFSHGKWSRYVCIHPENVAAEMIRQDYRDPTIYAPVRDSVCSHRRFWKREIGIVPAVSETCH